MSAKIKPCVLTIAGSDSGGNAGVQADLRAFHGYGLHGCTVFAALTAQNPRGVKSVHSCRRISSRINSIPSSRCMP